MAYSVREPSDPDEMSFVTLTVIRTGDQNRTSRVRTSTRDGSAKSGVDYEAHFKVIRFRPGGYLLEFGHILLKENARSKFLDLLNKEKLFKKLSKI